MTINIYSLWIGLIIFFQLSGFYLLDQNVIPTSDIALMMEVFFFVYVYIHNKKYRYKSEYSVWFISVAILAVSASFMALRNYSQPFMLGLRPQRAWIVAMLMYFPLNKLIKSEKYSIEKLLNTIDICNAIFMILVIIQYMIADKYMFFHVLNNQRYGSIRLYVQTIYLWISFMRHFCGIMEGTRLNAKKIFLIVSPLFILFFVTKSRMAMVACIASILIVLFRQRLNKKKIFVAFIATIAGWFFLSSYIGQDLLAMIFSPETSSQNTSEIRELGREFYISKLMSSKMNMMFGCGFPNMLWNKAVVSVGFTENMYIVDNGVFGQMFVYGFVYIIWLVTLYIKALGNAFKKNNNFLIGAISIGILGSYSLIPDCSQAYIVFPLLIAINENNDKI